MLQCCQNWRTGYVIAAAIKRTAPRTGLSVEHFRGWAMQSAFAVCIDTRRENGGGFQRGTHPPWHTTFGTEWKKSSVLYLLPRLAQKRGWTEGQPLFRTRKAGGGMERQQPFLRLLSEGAKGIYSPRPSPSVPPQRHQCGSLRRRSFSAVCSVFCARFSVRWKCAAVSEM